MDECLFTSNYARHGTHIRAVAISVKPPSWFHGTIYLPLAPTWDLVLASKKGEIDDEEYTKRYLELLCERKLDPHRVVKDLGLGAILLCYEKPLQFCHRHIAAYWLEMHTNIRVYEHALYTQTQNKPNVDLFFDP